MSIMSISVDDEGDLRLCLVGSDIICVRLKASNCCKTVLEGVIMSQFKSPNRTNSEEMCGARSSLRAISVHAGAEGVL